MILIILVALFVAYSARRGLARQALVGWLDARGVAAEAEVGAVGLHRFTGRIRAGPPEDPDFTAEMVDVQYSLAGSWTGRAPGLDVQSVRLIRPVLKVRWRNGALSAGSLDPLIKEFLARPPRPDVRQPLILIEDGLVRLDSPYGPAMLRADGRLQDGKLMRLAARLDPGKFGAGKLSAAVGRGTLGLVTRGDRVDLALDLPVTRLDGAQLAIGEGRLRLAGQVPYPDLKRRRGDGVVALRLIADGARLQASGARLQDSQVTAVFSGRSAGWIETLTLRGAGAVEAQASGAALAGATSGPLRVKLQAQEFAWGRTGGDAASARFRLAVAAERLTQGANRLQDLAGRFEGQGGLDKRGLTVSLRGATTARGSVAALGAARRDDPAELVALKRSLSDFTVTAPDMVVAYRPGDLVTRLAAPARLRPRSGGEARVEALGEAPLFGKGAGAFRLTTGGGGLPKAEVAVQRFGAAQGGLMASTALKLQTSFGIFRDVRIDAAGQLRVAGGAASFQAGRCAQVDVGRVDLETNDVEAVKAQVCQGAAPLLTMFDGGWRLRGQARAGSARVPFLEAQVSDGTGRLDFSGEAAGLRGTASAVTASVADAAATTRFNPIRVAGQAALEAKISRGTFTAADPAGRRLGAAEFQNDGASGRGGMTLDIGELAIAEGELQPAALSPIAAMIGSPARGSGRFTGAFDWTPDGVTSHGELDIERLDFQSPAGAVTGLAGRIDFTNLAPLATAPGQVLKAERIAAAVPLAQPQATFAIQDQLLKVTGGEAAVGGGRLRLEAFDLPLQPNPTWNGVLLVDGVQVKELIANSPFGDRMALEAKVTGRLPFEVSPRGLHIAKGELHAVEPGKLSIRRDALGPVAAAGEVAPAAPGAPPATAPEAPNAFTDFAYQAMENLSFNELSAQVDSLPAGRLGVLFHIKGEHTPPQHQEIRVSAAKLLDRSFLDKPLPLPSGVKVDLTLDTTLNLDQLLDDYFGYQQLRRSDAVQSQNQIKEEAKLPEGQK
jgi:hypothetical protein